MTEDEMVGWHHRFNGHAAASAKSLQPCLTLCDPIDSSPPGSAVPGILQARTLELVAISFSNAWKWKVNANPLSRVRLAATPGAAAYQAPPSMEFSRQEYWSGLPLPSPNGHEFEQTGSWRVGHNWVTELNLSRKLCCFSVAKSCLTLCNPMKKITAV